MFLGVTLQKCANEMSHFEALTDKNTHRCLLFKHLDKLQFEVTKNKRVKNELTTTVVMNWLRHEFSLLLHELNCLHMRHPAQFMSRRLNS